MKINFPSLSLLPIILVLACTTQKKLLEPNPELVKKQSQIAVPVPIPIGPTLMEKKEAAIAKYKGSHERKFDLLHTSLELKLDHSKQLVHGKAQLKLKPYFYPQDILELDAQDFEIHQLALVEAGEKKALASRYNGQKISVYLPQTYQEQDTLELFIKYTANPEAVAEGENKLFADTKGLYFINPLEKGGKPVQVWTQGETVHNSKWFPTIDAPNERATHDLKITVQDRFSTISNGTLVKQEKNSDGTRTDHWEMNLPHAPYLVAFALGEFTKLDDQWRGVPLHYYVEEAYKEGASRVFAHTPEMMTFFSEKLGVPFPWPKYDQVVVRDFVAGAMENTTVSIFMEGLNLDKRAAIDSEWDGIIAHELFHQWFGNYVTTESWAHLPLNEAFANYSEYLWYEYKEGRAAADLHHIGEMESYFEEAKEKQVDLIRYDYKDGEDMFDNHSYAKGGRVLHMLRKYLGDEAFFGGLHHYLEKNKMSSVEIHDLRLAMEEVTGKDLNWFFNQWFLASGHPILEIEFDQSVPENILLTVRQSQNLETTPLYQLPFKVSWYVDSVRKEKTFWLDKGQQQFALENGEPVDLVLFDEEKILLTEKRTNYGEEKWIKQYYLSDFGVSRYEALDSLINQGKVPWELYNKALEDDFWSLRELALLQLSQESNWEIGLEDEILQLAENDPVNHVRASAIEALSRQGSRLYHENLLRWAQDSSYYVAGAALQAYMEDKSAPKRKEVAERFSGLDNFRIVIPLIDYYTEEAIPGKGPWLHEKFNKISGRILYYLLGYYGDYFVRMPEEGRDKAISNLVTIAKQHVVSYVRLAAFQALFGFIEVEGVLEEIEKIREQETDPDIQREQSYYLSPFQVKN
ncbi:M1 family aminopeptidase [Echinicola jeungdonensis]